MVVVVHSVVISALGRQEVLWEFVWSKGQVAIAELLQVGASYEVLPPAQVVEEFPFPTLPDLLKILKLEKFI